MNPVIAHTIYVDDFIYSIKFLRMCHRILTGYGNKYRNITVLHQQNQGSGPARNRGIEHAAGKYICFMDSDDFYAHNRVLEQLYESVP